MTPHEILGIRPDATEAEIRQGYRRAAFRAHPDRGGCPNEFKKVHAAYEAMLGRRGWTQPHAPTGSYRRRTHAATADDILLEWTAEMFGTGRSVAAHLREITCFAALFAVGVTVAITLISARFVLLTFLVQLVFFFVLTSAILANRLPLLWMGKRRGSLVPTLDVVAMGAMAIIFADPFCGVTALTLTPILLILDILG